MFKYVLQYTDHNLKCFDEGLVEGDLITAGKAIQECLNKSSAILESIKLYPVPSILIKDRILELMAVSSSGQENGL